MAAPITISDTVFYGDGGTSLANLAIDDSQRATNLTVGVGGIFEANSVRMLQNAERTIDARFRADNTHAGYLWSYGGQRFTVTAGGTINAVVNSATVLALDATALFSASTQTYVVSWAMGPNPGGSGATALRSELNVWNVSTGAHVKGVVLHSAPTQTLTTAVLWAGTGAGVNAFTGTRTSLRFSTSFHTATETYEELIAASSTPTLAGEDRTHVVVPPQSSAIGDDGHFAGPISALAAAAAAQNDLRLAGPLVNIVARSRETHRGDRVGDEPFTLADPDGSGRYLYLHWLAYRAIPPGVSHVSARVFIQQWRTTGDDDDLEISVYSMDRPGWAYRPASSPVAIDDPHTSVTRNADDTSAGGLGEWVDFDNLRIARDLDGWSYFALGFRVSSPGGSGSTADQLWTVKAFIVDPIFEAQGAGLPGLGG